MNVRWLLVGLIFCSIIFTGVVSAESQYGKMDVYYNGKFLPGTEVAKPVLKIGEPFTLRVDATMYQECKVVFQLSELGSDDFIVIDGVSKLGEFSNKIFLQNETYTFEWTLKATDEWAGGTMPINFYYSAVEKGNPESIAKGEFTIAAPYITTEYYEGDTSPTTTTDPESPSSTDDPTTPSTPAFTILAAALALTIAARRS